MDFFIAAMTLTGTTTIVKLSLRTTFAIYCYDDDNNNNNNNKCYRFVLEEQ